MPRFSVITVCYNAANSIESTAASLRSQTQLDYEWLVVDGASTDSTLQAVAEAGIATTRIISEPDRGIYDAMNKAVGLANGDWVHFLNAGDELADSTVLADIALALDANPKIDLLYGDMIYVDQGQEYVRRFTHVRPSMLVFEDLNHQAVFARRGLFQSVGLFDLRFRTSADYDWLLRAIGAGTPTRYLRRLVARFQTGGAHAADIPALVAERRELRLQYACPWLLWVGMRLASVRRRWRISRGQAG